VQWEAQDTEMEAGAQERYYSVEAQSIANHPYWAAAQGSMTASAAYRVAA